IPLKGSLSLVDSAVLMSLFGLYMWMVSRMGVEEPTLAGPSAAVAELPTLPRRLVPALLFLFPGAGILASAEPFAESLIHLGKGLGVDEFIMVQWFAPLASEAPEMVIASIFALQGKALIALVALISSKVNQWTLLVGSLPVVYSVSLGTPGALPLDARQAQEVLLTAAQSAFAVALLINFRLTTKGALVLFVLFISQTFFPHPTVRYAYSFLYLGLAAFFVLRDRQHLRRFAAGLRSALRGQGHQ
ncbi:MAG: sodium:calcium antiporter, partial [Chloroflexota bacterium]